MTNDMFYGMMETAFKRLNDSNVRDAVPNNGKEKETWHGESNIH